MKKKLTSFVTFFLGNLALSYFFIEDGDIPSFLFVSAFAGIFLALTEGYQMKLVVWAVKKNREASLIFRQRWYREARPMQATNFCRGKQ